MSHTWHVYTIKGAEASVIVGCLATAEVRGEELTGEVESITPSYKVLTRAQTQAINTHGFVTLV